MPQMQSSNATFQEEAHLEHVLLLPPPNALLLEELALEGLRLPRPLEPALCSDCACSDCTTETESMESLLLAGSGSLPCRNVYACA